MAPPYIANCIRIAVEYGQWDAVNVLHVGPQTGLTPFTPAQVQQATQDFAAAWETNIMNVLSDQIGTTQFVGTDAGVPGGNQWIEPSTVDGFVAGEDLPPNVALAITWRTASTSRRKRGRTFLLGIPKTYQDVSGAYITDAAHSALDGAVAGFRGDLVAAGIPLVVASRLDGVGTPVTQHQVNRRFDTQRRRLPTA